MIHPSATTTAFVEGLDQESSAVNPSRRTPPCGKRVERSSMPLERFKNFHGESGPRKDSAEDT